MIDAADLHARALGLLAEWTRIPSVVGDRAQLVRMADAVEDWLRGLGAEIVAAGRACDPPIVHGRIDRGAPVTLLLYNMYDVMPATAAGWSVDPFQGGLVERPGVGPCFVGRGAENNKGPLAGMLVAVAALLAADGLDANLEILVEGEEETGSGGLRRYLLDPATPVRRADAALFPSFCEYGGGPPRVYLGFSGIAHGVIEAAGGAWGGPSAAIHSSNAPWIANPAWRLAQALAAVADAPTGRLARMPLPPDMEPVLDALAATFDPAAELAFRRSQAYAVDGSARDRLACVLTTASLSLASLATDPPDGRAVIPSAARARFDLRAPPGLAPDRLLGDLAARLAAFPGATLAVEEVSPGHRFAADAPGVAALVGAYRALGAAPQVWPWAIGAAPAHAFAAVAGSFLIGGLGRGGNAHGVDEFVTLDGLDRFLRSLLLWLPAIGRPHSPVGDRP